MLAVEPGLQAKTILKHLQQACPEGFSDGQMRTFRRRISYWRATEGPPREVFFAQEHRPGQSCQSNFTHCRELLRTGISQPVLTAPNQEWALDFVHDAIATGRSVRVLSVVDNFTRECLALESDTSYAIQRVTRVLEQVIAAAVRQMRCA